MPLLEAEPPPETNLVLPPVAIALRLEATDTNPPVPLLPLPT